MSPRCVLGRENVPCVAEVVNRSLKADCTDYHICKYLNFRFPRNSTFKEGSGKRNACLKKLLPGYHVNTGIISFITPSQTASISLWPTVNPRKEEPTFSRVRLFLGLI